MNAAVTIYESTDFDYKVDGVERSYKSPTNSYSRKRNQPTYRRRRGGGNPVQFNGIHRRRCKKIKW